MAVSWTSFLANGILDVVSFFRDIFYFVFPQSIVSILFLFPALLIVYGLVRFFHDCFKGV